MQFGNGAAGGLLLGFFACGADAAGEELAADAFAACEDLNEEAFAVVGAALGLDCVFGLAVVAGLEQFLKGGFGVADGFCSAHLVAECGRSGLENFPQDEAAGGPEATVEVKSCHDSFDAICEQGGFFASAAALFTASEEHVFAEVEARGDLAKVLAADEFGAEAGKLAFAQLGIAAAEVFGDEEADDGVAEELKLLVVGGCAVGGVEPGELPLVGERAVGEGANEQIRLRKFVLEQSFDGAGRFRFLFQGRNPCFHHSMTFSRGLCCITADYCGCAAGGWVLGGDAEVEVELLLSSSPDDWGWPGRVKGFLSPSSAACFVSGWPSRTSRADLYSAMA